MRLSGTYTPTKWDETTVEIIDDRMKLTKASVEFKFEGDIEAIGTIEYLMFYSSFDSDNLHKAEANYVGQMRIVGAVNGKSGSFVLNDSGTYSGGVAKSTLTILDGSGTAELLNISGAGNYSANQNGCSWEMDVTF